MAKTSSMASIISSTNIIEKSMDKIYNINEQINCISKRDRYYFNRNQIEKLLTEKFTLVNKVETLRKHVASIIFKDSGDYTILSDYEEFCCNMSEEARILENQFNNQDKIIPITNNVKYKRNKSWRDTNRRSQYALKSM